MTTEVRVCAVLVLLLFGSSLLASGHLDQEPTCAEFTMYSVAKIKGIGASYEEISRLLGPGVEGRHSFEDLDRAGRELGFFPVSLDLSFDQLQAMPTPVIVQTVVLDSMTREQQEHYVVILDVSVDRLSILDPPRKSFDLTAESFEEVWTGKAMVFLDSQNEANVVLGSDYARVLRTGLAICVLVCVSLLVTALVHSRPLRIVGISEMITTIVSRNVVACTVLAIVAGSLLAAVNMYSYLHGRSPKLAFEGDVVSLGTVDSSTVVPANVMIENSGVTSLNITAIHSTCSCVVPQVPPVIPGGAEIAVPILISANPGPGGTELLFESDDPRGPRRVKLTWFGTGVSPGLSPPLITRVFRGNHDIDYPVQIVVPYGSENGIRIDNVKLESESEHFSWRLGKEEVIKTANMIGPYTNKIRAQTVHLMFNKSSSPITTNAVFHVACAGVSYRLRMPIDVAFGPEVCAFPDSILFSAADAADIVGMTRATNIRHFTSDHDPAWRVISQPDGLAVDVKRVDSRETSVIVEALTDQFDKGEIVVESADGSEAVRIPVLKLIAS